MIAESAPRASLDLFLAATSEQPRAGEAFLAENARTLRIELDGSVWIKPGAAIGYRGEVAFERLATLAATSAAQAAMREAAPLVRASGRGRLYCASHGAHVHVVRLQEQTLVVASRDLLAFESSLRFDSRLLEHGLGVAAGGLVVTTLGGSGSLAIATHGCPLTLAVVPSMPVTTDPRATVAWSPSLAPALKLDLGWRSAIGHGGHEPVRMHFEGRGFVLIQSCEESGPLELHGNPIRRIAQLVTG